MERGGQQQQRRGRQPISNKKNAKPGGIPQRITLLTVREHQARRRERELRRGGISRPRTEPIHPRTRCGRGPSFPDSASAAALLHPRVSVSRKWQPAAPPRRPSRVVAQHQNIIAATPPRRPPERNTPPPRPPRARGLCLKLSPTIIVKRKCWWNNPACGVIQQRSQRHIGQQQQQERNYYHPTTRTLQHRQAALTMQQGRDGARVPGTESSQNQSMINKMHNFDGNKELREPRPPPIICPSPTRFVQDGDGQEIYKNSPPVSVSFLEASSPALLSVSDFDSGSCASEWAQSPGVSPVAIMSPAVTQCAGVEGEAESAAHFNVPRHAPALTTPRAQRPVAKVKSTTTASGATTPRSRASGKLAAGPNSVGRARRVFERPRPRPAVQSSLCDEEGAILAAALELGCEGDAAAGGAANMLSGPPQQQQQINKEQQRAEILLKAGVARLAGDRLATTKFGGYVTPPSTLPTVSTFQCAPSSKNVNDGRTEHVAAITVTAAVVGTVASVRGATAAAAAAAQARSPLNYWAPWRTQAPPSPAFPAPRPRLLEEPERQQRQQQSALIGEQSLTCGTGITPLVAAAQSPMASPVSPVTEAALILVSGKSDEDENNEAAGFNSNRWQFLAGRESFSLAAPTAAARAAKTTLKGAARSSSAASPRSLPRASVDSAAASFGTLVLPEAESDVEVMAAATAAAATATGGEDKPAVAVCDQEGVATTVDGSVFLGEQAVTANGSERALSTLQEEQEVSRGAEEESVPSPRKGSFKSNSDDSDDLEEEEVWAWSPDDVEVDLGPSDDDISVSVERREDLIVLNASGGGDTAVAAAAGATAASVDDKKAEVDSENGNGQAAAISSVDVHQHHNAEQEESGSILSDSSSEGRKSLVSLGDEEDEGVTLFDADCWVDFDSTNRNSSLYISTPSEYVTAAPAAVEHEDGEKEAAVVTLKQVQVNEGTVAEDAVVERDRAAAVADTKRVVFVKETYEPKVDPAETELDIAEAEGMATVARSNSSISNKNVESEDTKISSSGYFFGTSGKSKCSSPSPSPSPLPPAAVAAVERTITDEQTCEPAPEVNDDAEAVSSVMNDNGDSTVAAAAGTTASCRYVQGVGEFYGDSDAESEYTPEEALHVLKHAALLLAASGGCCESIVRDGDGGGRCSGRLASLSVGSLGEVPRAEADAEVPGGDKGDEEGSEMIGEEGGDGEEQLLGEGSSAGDVLAGLEPSSDTPKTESEPVVQMEKSFKKACRVLGIEIGQFFDTILESSLGDVDDFSDTDAAAAVAAAAAGITTPRNQVIVPPVKRAAGDTVDRTKLELVPKVSYKPLKLASINSKAAANDPQRHCPNSPSTPPVTPTGSLTGTAATVTGTGTGCFGGTSSVTHSTTSTPSRTASSSSIGLPVARAWRRLRSTSEVETVDEGLPADDRDSEQHAVENAIKASSLPLSDNEEADSSSLKTPPRTMTAVAAAVNVGRSRMGRRRRISNGKSPGGMIVVKHRGTNAVNRSKNVRDSAGSAVRQQHHQQQRKNTRNSNSRRRSKGGLKLSAVKVKVAAVVAAGTTAADAEKALKACKKNASSDEIDTYEDGGEKICDDDDHDGDFADEENFLMSPTMLRDPPSGQRGMLVSEGVMMENADVLGADLLLVRGEFHGVVDVNSLDVEHGASVRGDVVADHVIISGIFNGKMDCKKLLVVRRGGKCSGTVSYRDMRVEPGATLDADLNLLPPLSPAPHSSAPPSPAETRCITGFSVAPFFSDDDHETVTKGIDVVIPAAVTGDGDGDGDEKVRLPPISLLDPSRLATAVEVHVKVAKSGGNDKNVAMSEKNVSEDDQHGDDAGTEPASSAFFCPDSAMMLSSPGASASVTAEVSAGNSNNNDSDPAAASTADTNEKICSAQRPSLSKIQETSTDSTFDAERAEAAFAARFTTTEAGKSAALRTRRTWRQQAAAITAADIPLSPIPNRLLRKRRAASPAVGKRSTAQKKQPEASGLGGEALSRLQNTTGLSAAVAAMEEKQRIVEAERKDAEEPLVAAAAVAKTGEKKDEPPSVSGSEAWTIRTAEVSFAVLPTLPESDSASSPSAVAAAAAAAAKTIAAAPVQEQQTSVSKRFSRRGPPLALACTSPRAGAGKHLLGQFPASLSPPSSSSSSSSPKPRSRRFSPAESAALVEEGKKALLAIRQEKREHEHEILLRGLQQQEKRGRHKPPTESAWLSATPGVFLPTSPMMGTPPRKAAAAASQLDGAVVKKIPASRLPTGETAKVTKVPRSPEGFAPKHVSYTAVVKTPARAGTGRRQQSELFASGKEPSTSRLSAFLRSLVSSSSSSSSRSPGPFRRAADRTPECTPQGADDSTASRRINAVRGAGKLSGTVAGGGRGVGTAAGTASGPVSRRKLATKKGEQWERSSTSFGRKGERSSSGSFQQKKKKSTITTTAKTARKDAKKIVAGSAAGAGLVRQSRFRRSSSIEDDHKDKNNSTCISSIIAKTPCRDVCRNTAAATKGSSANARKQRVAAPQAGRAEGGVGGGFGATVGQALASRRSARGWRTKVSSGVEPGALWQ